NANGHGSTVGPSRKVHACAKISRSGQAEADFPAFGRISFCLPGSIGHIYPGWSDAVPSRPLLPSIVTPYILSPGGPDEVQDDRPVARGPARPWGRGGPGTGVALRGVLFPRAVLWSGPVLHADCPVPRLLQDRHRRADTSVLPAGVPHRPPGVSLHRLQADLRTAF